MIAGQVYNVAVEITRNLVFNEMRRTKRRPNVPLQSEPGTEVRL